MDNLEIFRLLREMVPAVVVVAIVGVFYWHKTREKELQVHQDMRIREMDHQRKMKELEVELEKAKARQVSEKLQQ